MIIIPNDMTGAPARQFAGVAAPVAGGRETGVA